MITTLLLLVVGQAPVVLPPLPGAPITFPPAVDARVGFIGTPGIAWNGSEFVIAWKDQRRSSSGSGGPATLFVTTWDAGSTVTFPQGRPLAGGPPGVVTPEPVLVAATNTTTFIGHVVPSSDGGTLLVLRATTLDGGVFGTWQALTPSVAVSRLAQQPALASSASSLLAAWYSDGAIHLYQLPSATRGVLDGGPNLSSLSVGEANGGFLVAWIDSTASPVVSLVSGAPPVELRRDVLPVSNAFRIEVAPSPGLRQVSVLVSPTTGAMLQHFVWNGGNWAVTHTVSGLLGTEAISTTVTPAAQVSTFSTTSGRFLRVTAPLTPGVSAGLLGFQPAHRTLALADDEDTVVALSTFDGQLYGQSMEVDLSMTLPTVIPRPPVPLLRAPRTQRFPSAVWSDADDRFLVAWDESQPDASFRVMTSFLDLDGGVTPSSAFTGAPVTVNGARPVLLRRPDGGELGVQLGPSPGSRAVYKVSRGGPPSLGAQLTAPGPYIGALMGQRSVVQWSGSAAGTILRTDFDAFPRLDQPGFPPACGFHEGDSFWFTLAADGGLFHAQVSDGMAPTVFFREAIVAPSSVCASRGEAPGSMAIAWRTLPGVMARVVGLPPTGASRALSSSSESPIEGPFVVPTRSGTLIVWTTDSLGVRASAFSDGGATLPFTLGSGEVANLSVTGSALGVAVVAWDRFDPDAGARQVELRLVDPPVPGLTGRDAGADGGSPDAGEFDAGVSDGGAVDAGEFDAGEFDAGEPDAGASNAGTLDGGAPEASDGGQSGTNVFVPTCGCGATGPSMGFTLVALLGLARARRRAVRGR